MDLNFTPEEEAFRAEVRAFLADKLPARLSAKVSSGKILAKADMEEWHAILNERGWLANHWPEQYGGPGWTAVEKFIFEHECALAFAPRIVPFGVNCWGRCSSSTATRRKSATGCRASSTAPTGGARAIRSPARAPIWRR
jgi:alkylation response protein AidB-like acyl-CoA dehydrogenase